MQDEQKYSECPTCGSEDIDYNDTLDFPSGMNDTSNQGGYCLSCGCQFEAVVKMDFVEFVVITEGDIEDV